MSFVTSGERIDDTGERYMLKELLPKYYFDQNYNCAEAILRSANEYYNLGIHETDMIIVGASGAGIQ